MILPVVLELPLVFAIFDSLRSKTSLSKNNEQKGGRRTTVTTLLIAVCFFVFQVTSCVFYILFAFAQDLMRNVSCTDKFKVISNYKYTLSMSNINKKFQLNRL